MSEHYFSGIFYNGPMKGQGLDHEAPYYHVELLPSIEELDKDSVLQRLTYEFKDGFWELDEPSLKIWNTRAELDQPDQQAQD